MRVLAPIYGIMASCWHPQPEDRPTFAIILERLGYCAQDPDVLNAPLPTFYVNTTNERDTTVIRPSDSNDNCLQVKNRVLICMLTRIEISGLLNTRRI